MRDDENTQGTQGTRGGETRHIDVLRFRPGHVVLERVQLWKTSRVLAPTSDLQYLLFILPNMITRKPIFSP